MFGCRTRIIAFADGFYVRWERYMVRVEQKWWSWFGLVMLSLTLVSLDTGPCFAQDSRDGQSTPPTNVTQLRNNSFGPENGLGAAADTALTSTQVATAPSRFRQTISPSLRGTRHMVRDGDLTVPTGPTAPVDGIFDLEPEPEVLDGADALRNDNRSEEDRAVFNSPAAGYDPLLFQIEDIAPANPQLNRNPRRLFTREPFDPVGVQVGSFVLFPVIETALNWSSNVFASPNRQSDHSYELRPSARLVSNWRAHAVELRGSVDVSSFDTFKTEDARGYQLEARGRLDITRKTNLQGVLSQQVSQESRFAIDASLVGDRADITVNNAALTLNHRFNRLSVQLRGAVTDFSYGDVNNGGLVAAGGNVIFRGTINNNDRDYVETRQAFRASWEFKPTLRVFSETELVQRDFDVVAASDNISRDSQGGRYRLGINFGSSSDILRGEVSLGYGDHRPKDSRLSHIDGFLVDANMAWRFNGLTSLLFTASTDVSETTTVGSGGVFSRQAGLAIRHSFRPELIGTAGLSYTTRNFSGVDFNESDLAFNLGGEYFLNRSAILFANYGHTISQSDFANSDYVLDVVRVGVRLRR